MCGIAGFFGPGTKEDLQSMIRALAHRGPDGEGFFMEEEVALGHRRLSIIDISGGFQPMQSSSGKSVIVFNGEIYNFKSLRQELEKEGFIFKTNSDTEVILNGYEKWGYEVVSKIDGMFALALWDKQKKIIFLARDRFGKKPLYFGWSGKTFLFASELKAVRQFKDFQEDINPNSLAKYLIYDFVPSPHSIFENIQKLDGGHFLIVNKNSFKIEKYFDPAFDIPSQAIQKHPSFRQAKKEFNDLFGEAVKKRLISDVPLGVFLSGGIDSSAIAAVASELLGDKLKTFSIGFNEKDFDESEYARLVAKKIGSEHYEKIFSFKDALDLVDKIPTIADEPLSDASLMPTYLLSAFAKENVSVVLGGDGGDELLLGYPTFSAEKIFGAMQFLPRSLVKKTIDLSARTLGVSEGYLGLDFKLRQFSAGLVDEIYNHAGKRHQAWLGPFMPEDLKDLLQDGFYKVINWGNIFEDVLRQHPNENNFRYLSRLYLKRYLQDEVLVKVDRASMANGLEARAPFLDKNLAQFLLNLPTKYKHRGFSGKRLLREAMKGKLPSKIINRTKKGFSVPLDRWISNELKDKINDHLTSKKFIESGLFNAGYIEKMLQEHYAKKVNHRKKIWNLFVLSLWFDNLNK